MKIITNGEEITVAGTPVITEALSAGVGTAGYR